MSQYAPIIITPESIKRSTHIARLPLGNYTVPVERRLKGKKERKRRGGKRKKREKKKGRKKKKKIIKVFNGPTYSLTKFARPSALSQAL
jgi:hypothetical protein